MKIGVNAAPLSNQITGIGQYTLQMLSAMIPLGHEWILYSPKPITGHFQQHQNVTVHISKWPIFKHRPIWDQITLPYHAAKDDLDIFWSPRHQIPILLKNKTRSVITIHDLVWKCLPNSMPLRKRWYEELFTTPSIKNANHIVSVSQDTANKLEHYFTQLPPIKVIHEGISKRPSPAEKKTLEKYQIIKPYLLFLGTREPRKNLYRLIQAFAQLPQSLQSEHQLIIAGSTGWQQDHLQPMIHEYALEKQIIILDYPNDTVVSTLIEYATALTLPSIYEGFGLPTLEAMAQNTPVLASRIPTLLEVCGDAALYVNPLNVDELSKGLARLLTEPALRQKLVDQGKERIKQFSWEVAAKKLINIFNNEK